MKVLVAVDGSDCSEKAFNWYLANTHRDDHEVYVCHEAEQPELPTSTYTMGGVYLAGDEMRILLAEHHKKCEELKNKYKQKCEAIKDLQYKVIVEATHKSIGHAIVQQAEKLNVDLIVIGSRGHGMLRRTILGSRNAKITLFAYSRMLAEGDSLGNVEPSLSSLNEIALTTISLSANRPDCRTLGLRSIRGQIKDFKTEKSVAGYGAAFSSTYDNR